MKRFEKVIESYMKTFNTEIDNIKYQFFFDPSIKSWTVYKIDKDGNQYDDIEYFANKKSLFANFPEFKKAIK